MTTAEVEATVSIAEAAEALGVSKSSAYRIFANEPGVQRIFTPGSSKPIIRVEVQAIDRVRRRSAIR